MHESGDLNHEDRSGTDARAQRCDTKTHLGNTPWKDGDGYLCRGAGMK
ncbi:hypothetical protein SM2011_b23188 (plasmid) [Sinorhizobium meliloti 2011]|nr:hypothetical protein SM2011_b23188 [Sinorhizobium meliloti 2011]